jgi:hypothetical protein
LLLVTRLCEYNCSTAEFNGREGDAASLNRGGAGKVLGRLRLHPR